MASTTRQSTRLIQGVPMHAPRTMGSHGENVYAWIEPAERFLTVWQDDGTWATYAKIAEHPTSGDAVNAMKTLGVETA